MTKREQIIKLLKGNELISTSAVEKKAKMTAYKLHSFIRGKAKITDEEASKVLSIIKNANKLQN